MRFILSVMASQAMNLMIGSGPSVNSKRSLSSSKAGIVFSGVALAPRTEIEIRRMEKGKGKSMTMLVNHGVRFLVGDVPRLRTGAVFLAVATVGIFVSGCNKSQATTAAPVAAVESAKAAVEQAELNLEWTKVTSLVDGIAGIAQVQIGNLVGPSSNLTSVSQVDPVKAFFPISEHEYLIAQSKGNASSSEHAIRFFGTTVELILADGSVYPQKGKVLLADRQVDPNTGTIRIVAGFPNPGNILRPGQYGRVRVQTSMKRDALLIPQSAVAQSQGSYQVAVVGNDHRVSMRTVKPGATVGAMWVIDEGVKPGEQVAAEGPQKIKEGTLVTPKSEHHSGEGN